MRDNGLKHKLLEKVRPVYEKCIVPFLRKSVSYIKDVLDNAEKNPENANEHSPLYRAINAKTPKGYKYLIIFLTLLVIIFIVWASISRIDAFVSASAKVETYSQVSSVSSSVPVYIKEIKVKEGDKVAKGQVLLNFDAESLQANLRETKNKYYFNLGNMAAILALINGEQFIMPQEVANYSAKVRDEVNQSYTVQRKYHDDSLKIINEQITQSQLEYNKLVAQKDLYAKAISIAEEEYALLEKLYAKELISKLKMLDSKQALIESKIKLDATEKDITKAESKIEELQKRRDQFISSFKNDVQKEYNRIKPEFATLAAKIVDIEEQLSRTVITSPIEGIVYKIPNTTVDSSIQQGQEIISIVPSHESLIVTADVLPEQIGLLTVGQKASVKIASFDYTIYGALEGRVELISPDTILNKTDNKEYFKVKIITDANYLEHNRSRHYIIPGMSAIVDIKVDSRTVMQYLLNPIIKTVRESLGEM